jgi:hypothetical protein
MLNANIGGWPFFCLPILVPFASTFPSRPNEISNHLFKSQFEVLLGRFDQCLCYLLITGLALSKATTEILRMPVHPAFYRAITICLVAASAPSIRKE